MRGMAQARISVGTMTIRKLVHLRSISQLARRCPRELEMGGVSTARTRELGRWQGAAVGSGMSGQDACHVLAKRYMIYRDVDSCQGSEPPRDLRRLQALRGWGHEASKQVFT